jgi:hypothetical protein
MVEEEEHCMMNRKEFNIYCRQGVKPGTEDVSIRSGKIVLSGPEHVLTLFQLCMWHLGDVYVQSAYASIPIYLVHGAVSVICQYQSYSVF